MSTGSKIEWTDETWNPVVGCTRVSPGCDHCYAVRQSYRLGEMARADREAGRDPGKKALYEGLTVLNPRGDRHFNGVVRCDGSALGTPLRWRRPRRVFVNSMADLFHEAVPLPFIVRCFAVMALCPQHTFQILTKRPERMIEMGEDHIAAAVWAAAEELAYQHGLPRATEESWPLPNVWLGTSVEDQAAADGRIPHLLRCPAAVRFLSCEPLLGPVNLAPSWNHGNFDPDFDVCIDWVIVGGESGSGARPCDLAWIRSIVQQCGAAQVACFVKQLGAAPWEDNGWGALCAENMLKLRDHKGGDPDEWPADLRVREWPNNQPLGKEADDDQTS